VDVFVGHKCIFLTSFTVWDFAFAWSRNKFQIKRLNYVL